MFQMCCICNDNVPLVGGVRLLPPTPNASPVHDEKIHMQTAEQLLRALGITDLPRSVVFSMLHRPEKCIV